MAVLMQEPSIAQNRRESQNIFSKNLMSKIVFIYRREIHACGVEELFGVRFLKI